MNYKTTTVIDEETYYYLYQIALELIGVENCFFNNINGIIKHVFKELMQDSKNIDFERDNMLQFVNVRGSYHENVLFLIFDKEEKDFLNFFIENLLKANNNAKIKKNQAIKSMIFYYYKSLTTLKN